MGDIPILKIIITQVQKEPANYRSFISIMDKPIIEPLRSLHSEMQARYYRASKSRMIKRKDLIFIARKNETLRRKEIVYTAEEWKQIEKKAAKCHLKTATFIRAMSLNGEINVCDLKELAPLLNGMRIISNNVNQVAKKANETNNIFAADVETLREEVGQLCRTVSQWLSTVTLTKP